jgi:hypothetical protein
MVSKAVSASSNQNRFNCCLEAVLLVSAIVDRSAPDARRCLKRSSREVVSALSCSRNTQLSLQYGRACIGVKQAVAARHKLLQMAGDGGLDCFYLRHLDEEHACCAQHLNPCLERLYLICLGHSAR